MLKGLEPGLYRVSAIWKYKKRFVYTFSRKRGRKPLCCHVTDSVDSWIHGRQDANRIEIVGTPKPKTRSK
jgi:hypothetical protein